MDYVTVIGLHNRHKPGPAAQAALMLTALSVFPADTVSGSAVKP